jgi:phosphatidylinositol alpha 1,6-mannosyltransferase
MHTEKMSAEESGEPTRQLRVAYFAGTMRAGQDGVTRVLYRLMESLREHSVDGIFISPVIPEPSDQAVPMFCVPSLTFPLYKEYRFAFPGYAHFEDRLRDFKPDLLHINSPCPLGQAAVSYGQRHGIPVVATYHTHFASYAKYYRIRALESVSWTYLRSLYNRCNRTYVPSLPIVRELEEQGIRNLEYLPHGVDNSCFNPGFRSEQWRETHGLRNKKVLLFVGRLVWEKDLKTLMEVYQVLAGRRSDWKLVVVGDGPIRNDLVSGMPEALFLGYQSGRDLSAAYASSDIFVFPSTTETFGNVTLEAMASGIVPICVREGGASGIIRDGINGFVAGPRDPADLVKRIEYLLDHPARRTAMAEQALAFARTQTWDQIFLRLFSSYREVLRSPLHRRARRARKAA